MRRLCPLPLCCLVSLPALGGCGETLDQAAADEHKLIDHTYDRQEQLVDHHVDGQALLLDELFGHAEALVDDQQAHHLELFDHLIDAQVGLFEAVLTAEPPPGFGPSTCSFSSEPSGAELFARNLFDDWEYVGRTPLVVERPLRHAQAVEVRVPGYASAAGHMISERVLGPCREHFVLDPLARRP